MRRGAVRNPLVVTDRPLYDRVQAQMGDLLAEWHGREIAGNRDKAIRRSESARR